MTAFSVNTPPHTPTPPEETTDPPLSSREPPDRLTPPMMLLDPPSNSDPLATERPPEEMIMLDAIETVPAAKLAPEAIVTLSPMLVVPAPLTNR